MLRFCGKGVYGAIAIGRIALHRQSAGGVRRISGADPEQERARVAHARETAVRELFEIRDRARTEVGEDEAEIFEIQAMMLEDEELAEAIDGIIEQERVNAEYAVKQAGEELAARFAALSDEYMRARATDFGDITARLLAALCNGGSKREGEVGEASVLCAVDLAPSETVSLDRDRILAFVTESGTPSSHTAILARTMNIPAVIGVGEGFLALVREGMTAIVNGYSGEVILEPNENELAEARERQRQDGERKAHLKSLIGLENVTRDGRRIEIYANIGSVDEVPLALNADAGGIGLFRSEFSYLDRGGLPSEEELVGAYRRLLSAMGQRRAIVRTLDLGADKNLPYLGFEREENPALGLRGARVYFMMPKLFRTQLRALYRASVCGRLGIMLPMIASEWEVKELLGVAREVREELEREGIPYSADVEHGIMIETPAAALVSDRLAPLVDFFSVGTNDLTQYTLASDRQNARLERFCDPHHEAVLRLIALSAEAAHRSGAWIGICGELAADPSLTRRFLQMGIDELSVSPSSILPLRETVRSIDLSENGK